MTCSKNNCDKEVHMNMNGIAFDMCTEHYLNKMSEIADRPKH